MEFVNRIKKKLADAKRDRYYRKKQLPWQLEGFYREGKEYVSLADAKSILIFTDKPTDPKLEQLRNLFNSCKNKAIEVLFVHYLPEDQDDIIPSTLPTDIRLQTITEDDISDLGEVSGPYLERMKAKYWDLVVLDLEKISMPLEYLLYLTKTKCIISDTDVKYSYSDVQYSTQKTKDDNLLNLLISKINRS